MKPIRLFLPAPIDMVTGGYAYDRRMLAGLRAAGCAAEAIALVGAHPLADDRAELAAQAAWAALPDGTLPVIDGLALPAFAPLVDALHAGGAVGLIHHPTALEVGIDEGSRDRLRAIEQTMLPRLARIIATSDATAARLVGEFGVAAERIAVVVPGTDPAPRTIGPGGPRCDILSVGTLVPRKGHDALIRALARLFDLDWHLTIVGAPRDAAHAAALTMLVEELGLAGRVTFAGALADTELDVLWRHADLFALATRFEGYGMAVAEALRRGLPVATTAAGAVGSTPPPEAAAICPVDDLPTLSKSLRRMIFDRPLRAAMADAAWTAGMALPDWTTQAAAFATALGLE